MRLGRNQIAIVLSVEGKSQGAVHTSVVG